MSISWKASIAFVFLVSCMAILTFSAPASAVTTYDFRAVSNDPTYAGDFSLQYIDWDEDGLFSLNELVPGSFSGVMSSVQGFFDTVTIVPKNNQDPLDALRFSPLTDGVEGITLWYFYRTDPQGAWPANPGKWTEYQSPVPIPPSAFLLGTGLLGLGVVGLRHRRRS